MKNFLKHISIIFILIIIFIGILSIKTNTLAAQYPCIGESYDARIVSDFFFLRKLDNINIIIDIIDEEEEIKVLGTYTKNSKYLVVEYNNKVGVMYYNPKCVLRKVSEFTYSDESYNAKTAESVNMRNKNGAIITTISEGENISVLGVDKYNSLRTVIKYNSQTGTILTDCISKTSSNTEYPCTGSSYMALITDFFYLRNKNLIPIFTIPEGNEIKVLGTYSYNSKYLVIEYNNMTGLMYNNTTYIIKYDNCIVVDIDKQTTSMYLNNELFCSDSCVTGLYNSNNATPKGIFSVKDKERNKTLTGRNLDGSRYESFVEFWIHYNGNYGLHDASWRNGKFGGNIYKYDGSHGCVNLPRDLAEKIYKNCWVGMKVIIK